MIVRRCDFCGSEKDCKKVFLPQPNFELVCFRDKVIDKIPTGTFYSKTFDVCPNCLQKIFDAIEAIKQQKEDY